MRWFDKWFTNKVMTALQEDRNKPNTGTVSTQVRKSAIISGSTGTILNSKGMQFTVYTASGGYVLEYNDYDINSDRTKTKLYIIGSEKDLGEGLAEVITIELLQK